MRTDLTNREFGQWTVKSLDHIHPKQGYFWLCECSCGTRKVLLANSLLQDNTHSCGCAKAELCRIAATKHGRSRTAEYTAWCELRKRCHSKLYKKYHRYGGRGIRVCRRWLDPKSGFENFLSDMGPRPSKQHSIDRRNNNGNYSPSNCYWATPPEQQNNRNNVKRVRHNGKTLTLAQWSKHTGIKSRTLYARLYTYGWKPHEALVP